MCVFMGIAFAFALVACNDKETMMQENVKEETYSEYPRPFWGKVIEKMTSNHVKVEVTREGGGLKEGDYVSITFDKVWIQETREQGDVEIGDEISATIWDDEALTKKEDSFYLEVEEVRKWIGKNVMEGTVSEILGDDTIVVMGDSDSIFYGNKRVVVHYVVFEDKETDGGQDLQHKGALKAGTSIKILFTDEDVTESADGIIIESERIIVSKTPN